MGEDGGYIDWLVCCSSGARRRCDSISRAGDGDISRATVRDSTVRSAAETRGVESKVSTERVRDWLSERGCATRMRG